MMSVTAEAFEQLDYSVPLSTVARMLHLSRGRVCELVLDGQLAATRLDDDTWGIPLGEIDRMKNVLHSVCRIDLPTGVDEVFGLLADWRAGVVRDFTQATGLHRTVVHKHLAELQRRGLALRGPKRGQADLWRLTEAGEQLAHPLSAQPRLASV